MSSLKQQEFDNAFKSLRSKGYNASDALRIAKLHIDKHYTPPVKFDTGKKSIPQDVQVQNIGGENYIDVLVGGPEMDVEAKHGGLYLDPTGWTKVPNEPLMSDINHFHFDVAQGNPNRLDEKWHGFTLDAEAYTTELGDMRAKVKIPDTELANEFLEDWKSGKYGVSAEYKYPSDALINEGDYTRVVDWEITGLTFEEDPSYERTKPQTKGNETKNESE